MRIKATTWRQRAYRKYLESEAWAVKRGEVLDALKDKCYECGSEGGNQVHHMRYASVWGNEEIEDFRVLCRACHKRYHRKRRSGNGKKKVKKKNWGGIVAKARQRKRLIAIARGSADSRKRRKAYKALG